MINVKYKSLLYRRFIVKFVHYVEKVQFLHTVKNHIRLHRAESQHLFESVCNRRQTILQPEFPTHSSSNLVTTVSDVRYLVAPLQAALVKRTKFVPETFPTARRHSTAPHATSLAQADLTRPII